VTPRAGIPLESTSVVIEHESGKLRCGPVPLAALASCEVLIRVAYAAVDRVDLYMLEGSHGMRLESRTIPRRDAAGWVVAAGREVVGLMVGDRVMTLTTKAHADHVNADFRDVWQLPDHWSLEAGASLPTPGRTAHDCVVRLGRLSAAEQVLVMAAGGAVGTMAVQIAHATGARVAGSVGQEWKANAVRALGADAVVDHSHPDEMRDALESMGMRKVDLVVESLGANVWPSVLDLLTPGGRIVTCGVSSGHLATVHLGQVMTKGLSISGVGRPPREVIRKSVADTFDFYDRHAIRPVVSRIYPLQQAAHAYALLASSAFVGRVLLRCTEPDETVE